MLLAAPFVAPVAAAEPSPVLPTPSGTDSQRDPDPHGRARSHADPGGHDRAAATPDRPVQPDPSPTPSAATPSAKPPLSKPAVPATNPVIPDAHGRYIVMLKSGADTAAAVDAGQDP